MSKETYSSVKRDLHSVKRDLHSVERDLHIIIIILRNEAKVFFLKKKFIIIILRNEALLLCQDLDKKIEAEQAARREAQDEINYKLDLLLKKMGEAAGEGPAVGEAAGEGPAVMASCACPGDHANEKQWMQQQPLALSVGSDLISVKRDLIGVKRDMGSDQPLTRDLISVKRDLVSVKRDMGSEKTLREALESPPLSESSHDIEDMTHDPQADTHSGMQLEAGDPVLVSELSVGSDLISVKRDLISVKRDLISVKRDKLEAGDPVLVSELSSKQAKYNGTLGSIVLGPGSASLAADGKVIDSGVGSVLP